MAQTQPNSFFDGRAFNSLGHADHVGWYKVVSFFDFYNVTYPFVADITIRNGPKALWLSGSDSFSPPTYPLAPNEVFLCRYTSPGYIWAALQESETEFGSCHVAVIVNPQSATVSVLNGVETTITQGIF